MQNSISTSRLTDATKIRVDRGGGIKENISSIVKFRIIDLTYRFI